MRDLIALQDAASSGTLPSHDNVQLIQLLLEAHPAAAGVEDIGGWGVPLYAAVHCGHLEAARVLLLASPSSIAVAAEGGGTVVHEAAEMGSAAMVQLVLSQPEAQRALLMTTEAPFGMAMPLHLAADRPDNDDTTAAVQLLVKAAPRAAVALATVEGEEEEEEEEGEEEGEAGIGQPDVTPLHLAARRGNASAVRALLTAAPQAARLLGWLDGGRCMPLHAAAAAGCEAAVELLLEAAPEVAAMKSRFSGAVYRTPLQQALRWNTSHHRAAARRLLAAPALPTADALAALAAAGPGAQPLFADAVAARVPLAHEHWALVPNPCPGLGRALPAALAHSERPAGQLVARLPPAEQRRLRTCALDLARVQRTLDASLPAPIARSILAAFDA